MRRPESAQSCGLAKSLSLIRKRRFAFARIAPGMRALDLREAVEGPGSDAGAIVIQGVGSPGRTIGVKWRSLRIGRIVWTRHDGRMLEQSRRVSILCRERGVRRQRCDEYED
jgi:hypothetical protein